METKDPLGYEFIPDRKITWKEITRFRHIPQKMGGSMRLTSLILNPAIEGIAKKGTIKGKCA